jgi:hypothetical protein
LLVLALGRDEPHAGALHRLAAGLGIGRIVLVGLDVGPNVLRRHQPHLVPELGQLTSPIVGRATGLQADQASRQGREELEHLAARQLALEQHAPLRIGAVHLEQVLCDVEANSRNLHLGRLPPSWSLHTTSTLALRCRQREASISSFMAETTVFGVKPISRQYWCGAWR